MFSFFKKKETVLDQSITITYNIGCRDCMKGDGVRHTYLINNAPINEYKIKTEYEVGKMLERWRKEDNHKCAFCRSFNVEVLNVETNDYVLYNYDRLVNKCIETQEEMLIVKIDKNNFQLGLSTAGSQRFFPEFLKKSIEEIILTINEQSEITTTSHKGHFFICVTGGFNLPNHQIGVKVQRFNWAGLTKAEMFAEIKPLANRVGVKL